MAWLEVDAISKGFGNVRALQDVSFDVAEGEFMCIVGPTNAGKSTLLKTIAGLYSADRGHIKLAGEDLSGLEPRHRKVSMLFQNNALFPTLSGFENIAFPLRARKLSPAVIRERTYEVAGLLKIAHLLDRLPQTYSGGEQQRVAIGRAIADPGKLLMLDEPLTNLDARLRIGLRIEFKAMRRRLGQTFLYVTHDQVEALSLSDRILILTNGTVQQIGSPEEIYRRPVNRFVAEFIGSPPMNFIAGEISGERGDHRLLVNGCELALSGIEKLTCYSRLPRSVELGVRPERIWVRPQKTGDHQLSASVSHIERLGSKNILNIKFGGRLLKAIVPPEEHYAENDPIWLNIPVEPEHLIDSQTDKFLR
jgi:multiple sugar transport system ATP-binding protein